MVDHVAGAVGKVPDCTEAVLQVPDGFLAWPAAGKDRINLLSKEIAGFKIGITVKISPDIIIVLNMVGDGAVD